MRKREAVGVMMDECRCGWCSGGGLPSFHGPDLTYGVVGGASAGFQEVDLTSGRVGGLFMVFLVKNKFTDLFSGYLIPSHFSLCLFWSNMVLCALPHLCSAL